MKNIPRGPNVQRLHGAVTGDMRPHDTILKRAAVIKKPDAPKQERKASKK